MKFDINKNCVILRNGMELWYGLSKIKTVEQILANLKSSTFIKVDDATFNSADIIGIFSVDKMEKYYCSKGYYKCYFNELHKKGEICYCESKYHELIKNKRLELSKDCNKCDEGIIDGKYCECCIDYMKQNIKIINKLKKCKE